MNTYVCYSYTAISLLSSAYKWPENKLSYRKGRKVCRNSGLLGAKLYRSFSETRPKNKTNEQVLSREKWFQVLFPVQHYYRTFTM